MKSRIQQIILLISLLFLMVGCAKEPMIKLNEENQLAIEEKKKLKEAKIQESLEASSGGNQEQSQDPSTKESSLSEITEIESTEMIQIDTSQWEVQSVPAYYEIQDFLPMKANEIRSFTNGYEVKTWYALYHRPELGQMQVFSIEPNENKMLIYRWNGSTLEEAKSEMTGIPFQEIDPWSVSDFSIAYQLPIAIGTKWDINGVTASISQIYQTIDLSGKSYTDVIEVAYGDQKFYYSKNIGLIAQTGPEGNWVLDQRTESVMLVTPMNIFLPDETKGSLLKEQTVEFTWQSNDRLESALTRLFKEQKIIGNNIMVNQVQVENNIAVIDFSSGVVATLNAHPQGEQAAIAAIIATLSQITGQEKVMLTVGGYGLAPETYPYPDNGLYQFNPQWLTENPENPLSDETTINGENISDPNTESDFSSTQSQ